MRARAFRPRVWFAGAIASALLAAPAAAHAEEGAITGATNSGTAVHVDNFSVIFSDRCDHWAFHSCTAEAYLYPSTAPCARVEDNRIWRGVHKQSDTIISGGTVDSGPIDRSVPRGSHRICLYSSGFTFYGFGFEDLEDEVVVDPPAIPPPPTAEPLTKREARARAIRALRRKFGHRFTRGYEKRIACTDVTSQTSVCRVRWTFRQTLYRGAVCVRGTRAASTVRIRVQRAPVRPAARRT